MANVAVPSTREAIADHAHDLFRQSGYTQTSVRAIAAAAGVDPALVIRHFGSKDRLFLEVVRVESAPLLAEDEPTAGLGTRLLDRIIRSSRSDLDSYQLLLRASMTSEAVRTELITQFESSIVGPLARLLGDRSGAIRARLVASALLGVMISVALYEDDVLASLPEGALTSLYGPALQAIIDAE